MYFNLAENRGKKQSIAENVKEANHVITTSTHLGNHRLKVQVDVRHKKLFNIHYSCFIEGGLRDLISLASRTSCFYQLQIFWKGA